MVLRKTHNTNNTKPSVGRVKCYSVKISPPFFFFAFYLHVVCLFFYPPPNFCFVLFFILIFSPQSSRLPPAGVVCWLNIWGCGCRVVVGLRRISNGTGAVVVD